MMKFFFMVAVGLGLVFLRKMNYWMSGGLVSVMYVFFSKNGLVALDYYYLGLSTGVDLISFSLIMLSFLVGMLMLFSSNTIYSGDSSALAYFYGFVYSLMMILIFTFLVSNLLTFYFFFEASLVPTLLIIMGWGYQPERLQAGVYFLFYTLGASLPLLVCIFFIWHSSGALELISYSAGSQLGGVEFVLFFFMTLAFMVSMPMFFSHLWLPSAHVEAPVSGSMILAGVLLKLGGYGMYRVFSLVAAGLMKAGGYYFGLSVLGMVYVGLVCCRLGDMSALVAYSSVAHMGMVICGLVSYYYWGFNGALAMMVAHGVCSSGLFCAANIYYERSGSRGFYLNSGLLSFMPIFTLLVFLLCGANMAAPPTMNLLSEIFLMGSMMKYDYLMLVAFPLGSYLGAVFTLFLFSYSQHGKYYEGGFTGSLINFRELHLMTVHLIPLNFLVLKSDFFLYMY